MNLICVYQEADLKKFISWNVNGIRACVQKDFLESFKKLDADAFCIQESKMQQGQLDLELEGYKQYWNYAERKGYSGIDQFVSYQPGMNMHRKRVSKQHGCCFKQEKGYNLTRLYPVHIIRQCRLKML